MKSSTEYAQSRLLDPETLAAYFELTKPGITMTVLASMLIGFVLGSGTEIDFFLMIHALLGTWLIASGTAAHNQFMEWRYDGQMNRTKSRPVPSSKISPKQSAVFSFTLMAAGLLYLVLMVNQLAAAVSLLTTLIYLGAYTPLKRVSAVNVLVGSVPGALPVVGGWAAAAGHLGSVGMWLLFGIVFLWQIPHVMAIAWVCKDDYSTAGFRMLPKGDEDGWKAAGYMLACLFALLPVSWAIWSIGLGGWIFLAGSMICGLVFLAFGLLFARDRDKASAKKLMFASFGYLPLVWLFVFIDQLLLRMF